MPNDKGPLLKVNFSYHFQGSYSALNRTGPFTFAFHCNQLLIVTEGAKIPLSDTLPFAPPNFLAIGNGKMLILQPFPFLFE
ncbi:hypothetical protein AS888_15600 [Peribacillus simplex]|uniref:Uncharacterized protein n=1 Tax=Peribacillus simplex TaxID=1478 RepID=A0A109N048_9BACI|nr:hypothetical protein [Peribacillus simplex]KWW21043.1 hypothetical protein AS888_15600 [Peribacillus simplex]